MLRDTDGVHGQRITGGGVRPSRAELDPAALDLLGRYGAEILLQARRFSLAPEDAEDAYQRGVEILLTKAPTTSAEELLPWLKTVVKHEALAIRRHRDRVLAVAEDGVVEPDPPADAGPHDRAVRLERLRLGAEALGGLKPQEVRCLLLKAEGHSYKQIQELTGFSYTKVDRCLKEGRRNFTRHVEGIESGAECDRLSGLLSRFADGEAGAPELAALRPHLRTCLTCRARLREYRAAPARVAALVPIAVVAVQPAGGGAGVGRLFEGLHERVAALAERVHGMGEMVSAGKIVTVAASTLAVAGGGTAAVREIRAADRPDVLPAREARLAAEQAAPVFPQPGPPAPARTQDRPAVEHRVEARPAEHRARPARPTPQGHQPVKPAPAPAPPSTQAGEFESAGPAPPAPPPRTPAPRAAPSAPGGGGEFSGP